MEFRRGGEQRAVLLQPRSVLCMADEARYAWSHYIPHRKSDHVGGSVVPRSQARVSLTFRQARGVPCSCSWPQDCDSQLQQLPPTRMQLRLAAERQATNTIGSDTTQDLTQQTHSPLPSQFDQRETDGGAQERVARGKPDGRADEAISDHSPLLSSVNQREADGGTEEHLARADGGTGREAIGARERDGCPVRDPSSDVRYDDATAQPNILGMRQSAGANMQGGDGAAQLTGSSPEGGASSVVPRAGGLESVHVHKTYDAIAPHFSATRFAVWPKVREFIDALPRGAVVLDVGCGNGKYFGVRSDIAVVGSDRSEGLVRQAAKRVYPPGMVGALHSADVLVADGYCLPFRSASADAVLSIAVLHHVTTFQGRVAMVREMARCLKPGGRGIITVWATEQEDPAKTIAKWHPLPPTDLAVGQTHPPILPYSHDVPPVATATLLDNLSTPSNGLVAPMSTGCAQQQLFSPEASETCVSGDKAGVYQDYLVPWHLPFHRAGAILGSVTGGGEELDLGQSASGACSASEEVSGAGQQVPSSPEGNEVSQKLYEVDEVKRTVKFLRYYHLFEEEELCEVVRGAGPYVQLLGSEYDKSNWVVRFERVD